MPAVIALNNALLTLFSTRTLQDYKFIYLYFTFFSPLPMHPCNESALKSVQIHIDSLVIAAFFLISCLGEMHCVCVKLNKKVFFITIYLLNDHERLTLCETIK